MAIKHLTRDARGSVLPMFALAIVPVFGLMGAAVDFSRASSARTEMQTALDAVALILSRDGTALKNGTLQAKAQTLFQAQFSREEAKNIQITAIYSTSDGGSKLVVNGSGTLDTRFMKLIGRDTMEFASSSTVRWGDTKLRVALALDNTGSMAQAGKMSALKTATKDLLKQLQDASKTTGDVQVAMVPFSKDVNVGTANVNAKWIDWSDWEAANGYETTVTVDNDDDDDDDKKNKKYKNCEKSGKSKKCTVWVPADHNTWNGCITDRDQSYDVDNATPDSKKKGTLFPAEQYNNCPLVPVKGLTTDFSALNIAVDQMQPNGNTNQTIGLAWAWQALTKGAPLNAPALEKDTNQYIILLTDGLNTENRFTQDPNQIDQRTQKVCDNIKKADIQIYAIQVNTGGDPTSKVLQDCASKPDMFFELKSAGQMVSTFNAIGTSIAKLRIAQ